MSQTNRALAHPHGGLPATLLFTDETTDWLTNNRLSDNDLLDRWPGLNRVDRSKLRSHFSGMYRLWLTNNRKIENYHDRFNIRVGDATHVREGQMLCNLRYSSVQRSALVDQMNQSVVQNFKLAATLIKMAARLAGHSLVDPGVASIPVRSDEQVSGLTSDPISFTSAVTRDRHFKMYTSVDCPSLPGCFSYVVDFGDAGRFRRQFVPGQPAWDQGFFNSHRQLSLRSQIQSDAIRPCMTPDQCKFTTGTIHCGSCLLERRKWETASHTSFFQVLERHGSTCPLCNVRGRKTDCLLLMDPECHESGACVVHETCALLPGNKAFYDAAQLYEFPTLQHVTFVYSNELILSLAQRSVGRKILHVEPRLPASCPTFCWTNFFTRINGPRCQYASVLTRAQLTLVIEQNSGTLDLAARIEMTRDRNTGIFHAKPAITGKGPLEVLSELPTHYRIGAIKAARHVFEKIHSQGYKCRQCHLRAGHGVVVQIAEQEEDSDYWDCPGLATKYTKFITANEFNSGFLEDFVHDTKKTQSTEVPQVETLTLCDEEDAWGPMIVTSATADNGVSTQPEVTPTLCDGATWGRGFDATFDGFVNEFKEDPATGYWTFSNPGNERTISDYLDDNLFATPNGFVFRAPCGLGKTKFAPTLLAQRLGFKAVTLITERIIAVQGAYDWYLEHPLEDAGRITARAGSVTKTHDFGGTVDMLLMTVNAYYAAGCKPVAGSLLILDECHNLGGAALAIRQSADPKSTVYVSASHPLPGMKVDLQTPCASTITVVNSVFEARQYQGGDVITHQLKQDTRSSLVICPTASFVRSMAQSFHGWGGFKQVLYATKGKMGRFVSNTATEIPLNLTRLIAAISPGTLIIATDVIQESATLPIHVVYDYGTRARPSFDAYRFGTTTWPLKCSTTKTALASVEQFVDVIVKATYADACQVAGRVGRLPEYSPGRAFILTAGGFSDDYTRTISLDDFNARTLAGNSSPSTPAALDRARRFLAAVDAPKLTDPRDKSRAQLAAESLELMLKYPSVGDPKSAISQLCSRLLMAKLDLHTPVQAANTPASASFAAEVPTRAMVEMPTCVMFEKRIRPAHDWLCYGQALAHNAVIAKAKARKLEERKGREEQQPEIIVPTLCDSTTVSDEFPKIQPAITLSGPGVPYPRLRVKLPSPNTSNDELTRLRQLSKSAYRRLQEKRAKEKQQKNLSTLSYRTLHDLPSTEWATIIRNYDPLKDQSPSKPNLKRRKLRCQTKIRPHHPGYCYLRAYPLGEWDKLVSLGPYPYRATLPAFQLPVELQPVSGKTRQCTGYHALRSRSMESGPHLNVRVGSAIGAEMNDPCSPVYTPIGYRSLTPVEPLTTGDYASPAPCNHYNPPQGWQFPEATKVTPAQLTPRGLGKGRTQAGQYQEGRNDSSNDYGIDRCYHPFASSGPIRPQTSDVLRQIDEALALYGTGQIFQVTTWPLPDELAIAGAVELRLLPQGESQPVDDTVMVIHLPAEWNDKAALAKARLLPLFSRTLDRVICISNARVSDAMAHPELDPHPAIDALGTYDLVSITPWQTPSMENLVGLSGCRRSLKDRFLTGLTANLYIYGCDNWALLLMHATVIRTQVYQTPVTLSEAMATDVDFLEVHNGVEKQISGLYNGCHNRPFPEDAVVPEVVTTPVPWFKRLPIVPFVPLVLLWKAPYLGLALTSGLLSWYTLLRFFIEIIHYWDCRKPAKWTATVEPYYATSLSPDIDTSEYVLLIAFGTHGDQVPVLYYARLLASLGVKTAYYLAKHDTAEDLRRLAAGNPYRQIPGFLASHLSGDFNWKHVVLPYSTTTGDYTNFSLTPSDLHIQPITFGDTFVGHLMGMTARIAPPGYRIGALTDSITGRSADGWTLLTKRHGTNSKLMFTTGSDIDNPAWCYQIKPVPKGDHVKHMSEAKVVYCHGGAGTMQTAIMSGSAAYSYGTELDRRYHRVLTPDDAHNRSPRFLLAQLKWVGGAPLTILDRYALLLGWAHNLDYRGLVDVLVVIARLYALMMGLASQCNLYAAWAATIFGFTGRLALPTWPFIKWYLGLAYAFPILLYPSPATFIGMAVFLSLSFWRRLFHDALAFKSRWRIRFYGLGKAPWLPGHMALFDTKSKAFYEGGFTTGQPGLYADFIFRRSQRPPDDDTHKFEIPAFVDEKLLVLMLDTRTSYSTRANCQTQVMAVVHKKGLFHLLPAFLAVLIGQTILAMWVISQYTLEPIALSIMPELAMRYDEMLDEIDSEEPDPKTFEELEHEEMVGCVAELMMLAMDNGVPKSEAADMALMALRRKFKADSNKALENEITIDVPAKTGLAKKIEDFQLSAKNLCATMPVLVDLLRLLEASSRQCRAFTWAALQIVANFLRLLVAIPSDMLKLALADVVITWIDETFTPSAATRRAKAVWALGGVISDPYNTAMRQFTAAAALSHFEPGDFEESYSKVEQEFKAALPSQSDKVGGDQHRPVHTFKRPVMSEQEARLLGHIDGIDPNIIDALTRRAQRYLDMGAPQGVDGVYLGVKEPDRLVKSIERYSAFGVPPPLSSWERERAHEIAEAIADKYPDAILNAKPTPLEAILRYSKLKYSPGSPFISHYRSRQEMYDAGWNPVLLDMARGKILAGEYPAQWYHAFAKSQVVDGQKILEGKNIRTVVSQDLLTYFIDQFVQFERNKRDTWWDTNIGSGMPLNQNMLRIFEQLKDYPQVIAADATEYDARLLPFQFEVLTKLAALGYQDHPDGKVLASIMKSKYQAMQAGFIWGLTIPRDQGYPTTFRKLHGGGTGQSATSWDNTYAMKATVCAAWMDYQAAQGKIKSAKDFFKDTLFANTSDDNIWGLNEKLEAPELFVNCAAKYGMIIRIEGSGSIEDVFYLGHGIRRPNESDAKDLAVWKDKAMTYKKYGVRDLKPVLPEYVVYQETSQLLMRRMAFRYYQADLTGMTRHSLERSVGHAALTAFNKSLYSLIMYEYLEDARAYLGPYRDCIQIAYDDETNTQYLKFDGTKGPPHTNPRYHTHYQLLRKAIRFPTYQEVLRIHMRPIYRNPNKDELRLQKLNFGLHPPDIVLKNYLDIIHEKLDKIPRELYKSMPGIDMLYPEPLFDTVNQIIEKFLWRMSEQTLDENPSLFSRIVMESPYGSAANSLAFQMRMASPEWRAQNYQPYTTEALRGAVIGITAMYYLTWYIEAILYRLPFLGLLFSGFFLFATKMPKVYGLLNLFGWHLTGRSSVTIAMLMPRDPYMFSKQFSAFIVDLTFHPLYWVYHFIGTIAEGLASLVPLLEKVVDIVTRAKAMGVSGTSGKHVMEGNEWSKYVPDIMQHLDKTNALTISAPTGTGKSTWLPAAILDARHTHSFRRIIHLVPRKILRDDTHLPNDVMEQALSAGVALNYRAGLLRMTYGHFLQRREGNPFNAHDLFFFDEFHEKSGEMIEAAEAMKEMKCIFLSATPICLPFIRNMRLMKPLVKGKGFGRTVEILPGTVIDKIQWLVANRPSAADRVLVVVPTLASLDKTIESIRFLKLGEVSEFSRRNRVMSPTARFIVSTPIIDAGYDASPPFNVLIDSGQHLVFDRGYAPYIAATDQTINIQRQGRVGRLKEGLVLTTPSAGTGPSNRPYPTPSRLANAVVAQDFRLPHLETVTGGADLLPYAHVTESETDVEHWLKCWFTLCALSGIPEQELIGLYGLHVERQLDYREEMEWLKRNLPPRPVYLPPYHEATAFTAEPFIIIKTGKTRTLRYFRLENGQVTDSEPAKRPRNPIVPEITALTSSLTNRVDEIRQETYHVVTRLPVKSKKTHKTILPKQFLSLLHSNVTRAMQEGCVSMSIKFDKTGHQEIALRRSDDQILEDGLLLTLSDKGKLTSRLDIGQDLLDPGPSRQVFEFKSSQRQERHGQAASGSLHSDASMLS